ncbi:MAG TPA: hypothetical protein VM582_08920 [Candidatus Thermoplasmatota archaeon]|nr:hypothetical protein [Candidatus Thermoplasmatota archaeon]
MARRCTRNGAWAAAVLAALLLGGAGGANPALADGAPFAADVLPPLLARHAPADARLDDPSLFPLLVRGLLADAGQPSLSGGAAQADSHVAGVVRVALAGGDFTGDGRPDLLVQQMAFQHITLAVHDAETGERVWARGYVNPHDLVVLPPTDLDGDGTLDVPVLAFYRSQVRLYQWVLHVLDGATGGPLWSRAYAGAVVGNAAGWTGVHVVVVPFVQENDVAVSAVDISYHTAVGVLTTRAHVLSGADGSVRFERHGASTGGNLLLPARQAVRDPHADWLWTSATFAGAACVAVCAAQTQIAMVDGSTGATVWSRDVPTGVPSFAFPLGADLNGDGFQEVEVRLYDGWSSLSWYSEHLAPTHRVEQLYGTWSSQQRMHSGRTGLELWRNATPGDMFRPVQGSFGGGPGADLLYRIEWWRDELLAFLRVDGATGARLGRLEIATPGDNYRDVRLLPDLDGDGAPELWFGVEGRLDESMRQGIVSTATGAPLWDGPQEPGWWRVASGHFDGDALPDVLVYAHRWRCGGQGDTPVRLVAVNAHGTMWSRAETMPSCTSVHALAVPRVSESGSDVALTSWHSLGYDVIWGLHELPTYGATRIDVLRGADGSIVGGVAGGL